MLIKTFFMISSVKQYHKGVRGIETIPPWSFLSNHGAVLLLVSTVPQITATQIGAQLGITERPVRRIISELEINPFPGRLFGTWLWNILHVRSGGTAGIVEQAAIAAG